MSDMTCRYCGARIVWAEGRGWLTVSDSRVVWNTESCVARPTTKGGPEAGHALLEEEPPVPTPDPYVPTTELVAAAREWVQEENWESSYESDGFNRPGTNLITDLADEVERLQSLLATAGADGGKKALHDAAAAYQREWIDNGFKPEPTLWLKHRADSMEGKAHDQ